MSASQRKVTLCGEPLHGLQHICAFFDSREEQYDILNPYFREGLDTGDEVVTMVESAFRAEHVHRMAQGGVDVDKALARGQLKVVSSEDAYLKDNVFTVDRMYAMLKDVLCGAVDGPYKAVRTMGDMEWALRNLPGTDELIVYEARVNLLAPQHDCTLLCAYDVNRFSGRIIADVLATHSHVLMNGKIHENPYFLEPVTYLHKLALRKSPGGMGLHFH